MLNMSKYSMGELDSVYFAKKVTFDGSSSFPNNLIIFQYEIFPGYWHAISYSSMKRCWLRNCMQSIPILWNIKWQVFINIFCVTSFYLFYCYGDVRYVKFRVLVHSYVMTGQYIGVVLCHSLHHWTIQN